MLDIAWFYSLQDGWVVFEITRHSVRDHGVPFLFPRDVSKKPVVIFPEICYNKKDYELFG